MSKEQYRQYKAFEKGSPEAKRIMKKANPNVKEMNQLNAFLNKTRQLSNAPMTSGDGSSKIEAIVDRVNNGEGKDLIYSNFLGSGIAPLSAALEAQGIEHGVFTGSNTDKEKKEMVEKYNNDKLKALLISSSGAEGLDLKGTRRIHVTEPHWHNSKIKQIEGRGARYKSHEHLPEDQRNVEVLNYLATRPEGILKSKKPTADQYLYNMAERKDKLNAQFLEALKKGAIENSLTKTAGGPGSGVGHDNTKKINLPQSAIVSVGTRTKMFDKKKSKKRKIKLSEITAVGQEKYVPAKLKKFLRHYKDWDLQNKPFDVLEVADGSYHVIDGHHRFLAAKKIGAKEIIVNVFKINKKELLEKLASKSPLNKSKSNEIKKDRKQLIEEVAELKHEEWLDLAGGVLHSEEGLSDKRKKRWSKYMTDYKDLNEHNKEKDRKLARDTVDLILGKKDIKETIDKFKFNKKNKEKKASNMDMLEKLASVSSLYKVADQADGLRSIAVKKGILRSNVPTTTKHFSGDQADGLRRIAADKQNKKRV